MTVKEILSKFETLGDEAVLKRNLKYGAGDNQFGVKMGDLRTIAKKIKTNHELAKDLWATGNLEARLLATLIVVPKKLTAKELEDMVSVATFYQLADWLNSYVVKEYPDKETLRQKWMVSEGIMTGRAAWSLTAGRVARSPEGLDLPALLDRIESEMAAAAPEVQWTMNTALAQIGICFPEHRDRALSIGEKLGIYRDYPVSKGCTSPFAPIWINELVKRQNT
ncbi:DNA alkylation repair protein [Pedobacter caeni]|uniref:3-methyladenine DNA glycosylase AlkD n=1 Tax=Pedobacter caeni TaxID=288992 RepID=A0A1M4TZ62_9SPHI|nr:DNA alkylation repair protein [Pedobacter caeni]SHE49811.1 3-methyladenine DNA glycosylase AlkD [Pedobacter caeni]